MEHGFAKLANGPDAFAHILQAMGVPAPHFMAWSTILVEILGGLAVILGAFVTLASLPMAAVLLVAMFTVHLPYGFSAIKLQAVTAAGAQFGPPGYEVDLLYLACLAALVLGGPGPVARRTGSTELAEVLALPVLIAAFLAPRGGKGWSLRNGEAKAGAFAYALLSVVWRKGKTPGLCEFSSNAELTTVHVLIPSVESALIPGAGAGGPGLTGTLPCLAARSVLKPTACRTILPFRAGPKVPAF
jgi:putative oxidoreductase